MLSWIPALPEVASEAVAELQATECEPIKHADMLLFRWKEGGSTWVREHPAEAVAIIGFLAKQRSLEPWGIADAVTQLGVAFEAGTPREHIRPILENIAEIASFPAVRDFMERLSQAP